MGPRPRTISGPIISTMVTALPCPARLTAVSTPVSPAPTTMTLFPDLYLSGVHVSGPNHRRQGDTRDGGNKRRGAHRNDEDIGFFRAHRISRHLGIEHYPGAAFFGLGHHPFGVRL